MNRAQEVLCALVAQGAAAVKLHSCAIQTGALAGWMVAFFDLSRKQGKQVVFFKHPPPGFPDIG